MAVVSAH